MIDRELIKRALAEDLDGGQDITSVATVSGSEKIVADFISRSAGVIAGIDMARAVLEEVGLIDISVFVAGEAILEQSCWQNALRLIFSDIWVALPH